MGSRRRVVALFLLAALWAWGNREASAGGISYSWAPLHSGGWDDDYPSNNDYQTFATSDGSLTIYWDPSAMIPDSYVTASSGTPGYEITAYYNLTWSGDILTGEGPYVATVTVYFGDGVSVGARGGYHQEFGFQLESVPEPSTLLMLPIGIVGVALGRGARRRKKRPGP